MVGEWGDLADYLAGLKESAIVTVAVSSRKLAPTVGCDEQLMTLSVNASLSIYTMNHTTYWFPRSMRWMNVQIGFIPTTAYDRTVQTKLISTIASVRLRTTMLMISVSMLMMKLMMMISVSMTEEHC